MILIPEKDKKFAQSNNSDVLGNLFATFNMDFSTKVGVMRAGKRLVLNTGSDDVSDINNYPVGFKYFDNGTGNKIYTIAGKSNVGSCFVGGSILTTAFSKVTGVNAPTGLDSAYCDIETAFGELYVSQTDNTVHYLNSSNAWSFLTAGATGSPVMLLYFPFTDRMYCTKGGNVIQSWDSSHTVVSPSNTYALQLRTGENITWLRASSNRIWIGTVNTNGGPAYIYEWNGTDTQFTKSYKLKSSGALSCVIKDDVPYVVDANGNFLVWTSGTFKTLTQFNRKNRKTLYNASLSYNQRFIHPNGMNLVNGEINILVDLTNNDASSHAGTQEDCNPSGIWYYDEDTQTLKHKHSFTLTKSGSSIVDYGQFKIFGAGGIAEFITTANIGNGTFICGATYYSDATTTKSGIFYDDNNDTLQKYAYMISARIFADELSDTWDKIIAVHKILLGSTDKIYAKYRFDDQVPVEATITWTSTTSFTASGIGAYVVGDEVEVLQGTGSGFCSHISSIQATDNGYMVTVDETYTGATGTAIARFQKWVKLQTAGNAEELPDIAEFSMPDGTARSQIQLKICMLFTGQNEIQQLMLINSAYRKAQ